jgi:hypothetical protein
MTRERTLYWRAATMTRKANDLRLITYIPIFAASMTIGCDASTHDIAPDSAIDASFDGAMRADSSHAPDVAGGDDAVDDTAAHNDAPRGLVVLPAQFTEENMPMRMLREGDPIDLWPAPQGGHVVLVAAKVKHFVGDTAMLRVSARYPDTPFIVAEEARSVKLVPVPGEPDTMQPDLRTRTQVAHIPLCPDYDPMDIVDRPLEFAITLTSVMSDEPQTGAATLRLYPNCASSGNEPFCKCECRADYFLGKCPRDGGARD